MEFSGPIVKLICKTVKTNILFPNIYCDYEELLVFVDLSILTKAIQHQRLLLSRSLLAMLAAHAFVLEASDWDCRLDRDEIVY